MRECALASPTRDPDRRRLSRHGSSWTGGCPSRSGSDRSSDRGHVSGLEHFDLERELDLFADQEAAGLECDVPGQAPVLAVDARVRAETRVDATHRILRLT